MRKKQNICYKKTEEEKKGTNKVNRRKGFP